MKANEKVEEFPYKTYLNILHGPLELIDVQKLVDEVQGQMVEPDPLQSERIGSAPGDRGRRISLA